MKSVFLRFYLKQIFIFLLIVVSTCLTLAQTSTDMIPADYRADEQKPTLVMFTASWCGPCQFAKSVIFKDEEVSSKLRNFNILYFDVDTPTGKKFRQSYGCDKDGVPTFLLLDKEMKVVDKQNGISDKSIEFINFLNKIL